MTARAMFTTPAAHLFSGDRGRTCMNSIGLVFSPTGARDGCASVPYRCSVVVRRLYLLTLTHHPSVETRPKFRQSLCPLGGHAQGWFSGGGAEPGARPELPSLGGLSPEPEIPLAAKLPYYTM